MSKNWKLCSNFNYCKYKWASSKEKDYLCYSENCEEGKTCVFDKYYDLLIIIIKKNGFFDKEGCVIKREQIEKLPDYSKFRACFMQLYI